jgi:predicted DNA-binding transcriptional regulator YafY
MQDEAGQTLARQWAMLRALPRAPRKATAGNLMQALADEGFVVSRRTIERDLHALSVQFPLLLDDRAKPYGWSWARDANFEFMPGLTPPQAVALLLAKAHLRALLPQAMRNDLAPVFEAAEAALRTSGWKDWHRRTAVLPTTLALRPPKIERAVLADVHTAIARGCCLSGRYRAKGDVDQRRMTIHPLGLLIRGPVQYLVCTLYDYTDIRQLAVHRLAATRLLPEPRRQPDGFEFQRYATEASSFDANGTIRLVIRLEAPAAEHLRETPLSNDQTWALQSDDRVEITATVEDTAQLRWWLLAFGSQLEVMKPGGYRNQFANELRLAAGRYAKPTGIDR